MGDTTEDMDIEVERKDKEIDFLENKTGVPDCKFIEEMNIPGLKKRSLKKGLKKARIKERIKKKGDRIMERLNKLLEYHKYIKNKNQ